MITVILTPKNDTTQKILAWLMIRVYSLESAIKRAVSIISGCDEQEAFVVVRKSVNAYSSEGMNPFEVLIEASNGVMIDNLKVTTVVHLLYDLSKQREQSMPMPAPWSGHIIDRYGNITEG